MRSSPLARTPSGHGKLSFVDVDNGDRMYGTKTWNFSIASLSLSRCCQLRVARRCRAEIERAKERTRRLLRRDFFPRALIVLSRLCSRKPLD